MENVPKIETPMSETNKKQLYSKTFKHYLPHGFRQKAK